jgi:hypothetical protein
MERVEFDEALEREQRRYSMVLISVLSGLLLAGYGISRVRAKSGRKPDVQTLFGS